MPFTVDFKPLRGADFSFADVIADTLIKNLRPAAGIESTPYGYHQIENLVVAFGVLFGEKVHFGGCEGFNMEVGGDAL
jgi:hypothetical protein